MRSVLAHLTIVLLLATAFRLGMQMNDELRESRQRTVDRTMLPLFGSLHAIAGNRRIEPRVPEGKHAQPVVLFVVHRKAIEAEIGYWNRVVSEIGKSLRDGSTSIEFWGICDLGAACDRFGSTANFLVAGYLDAFQMHILAERESSGMAILYDPKGARSEGIQIQRDPAATAESFIRKIKQHDSEKTASTDIHFASN